MKKEKFDFQVFLEKLEKQIDFLRRYSVIIFVVFVAALYGFLFFQIGTLSSAQPSQAAVSSQVQAEQLPHISQSVVNQLQTLQNNSVNVQALFNQARNNPFQ